MWGFFYAVPDCLPTSCHGCLHHDLVQIATPRWGFVYLGKRHSMENQDIGFQVGFVALNQYFSQVSDIERRTVKAMDNVAQSGKRAGRSFREFADEIPGVGRAMQLARNPVVLFGAAVVGVVGILGKGISAASEFENQFLELRNLNLDKTAATMDGVRQSVLDLSLQTGIAATQASKSFFDVQSATGLFGDQVEDVVRQVGIFATATKTDMDAAINQTVKGMAAFGFQVDELNGFLASNFATVQLGVTTYDQLAKVQVQFSGAAAAANQTVDEANKLFAINTKLAQSTAEAATLTKTAFQDLGKKNTVDGLAQIGVSVFDAAGSMRSITDISRDLVPQLKRLSGQDFAKLKDQIGGSEGLRAFLDAARNSGDDLLDTFDEFDKAKEKFDVNALLENAKGDFTVLSKIVGEQLNTVFIQLGSAILPIIARVLDSISGIIPTVVQFFHDWSGVIETLIIGVGALATALGIAKVAIKGLSVATTVYNAVMVFSASVMRTVRTAVLAMALSYNIAGGGIRGVAAAVQTLTGSLRANPFTAAAVGVTALAAGLIALVGRLKNTETQMDRVRKLSDEVAAATGRESAEANRLFEALKNPNLEREHKGRIIKTLIEKYGQYLGDLSDEETLLNNIELAQRRVNNAIEQSVISRIKQEKQEGLYEQKVRAVVAATGEILAQIPIERDELRQLVDARVAAIKSGEDLMEVEQQMVRRFARLQDAADMTIDFSDATRAVRNLANELVAIDKDLAQVDQDFSLLGDGTLPIVADAVDEVTESLSIYAANSIKGVSERLKEMRDKLEGVEFGTALFYEYAASVRELRKELDQMRAAAEFELRDASMLTTLQTLPAPQFPDAVIPVRGPDTISFFDAELQAQLDAEFAQMLAMMEKFQGDLAQLAQGISDTLVNGIGDAFFNLGKAFGSGLSAGEAFKSFLVDLGKLVLVEVPKLVGLFMLQTAVGLGFPAGVPFAVAGVALLALSGLAGGLLDKIAGAGAAGQAAPFDPGTADISAPQQQVAAGLSAFNAQDFGQAHVGLRIYIGNEEVTRFIRTDLERELDLQGG